jgi:predicted ATPase/transcriptional regulator with XRE-family HTH domain
MNHPAQPAPVPPHWSTVLRGLREAHGVTQDGWAALIGVGRATVQRWEHGDAAPGADTAEALLTICREQGLLRTFERGPLGGLTVTAELLRELLAEARRGVAPRSVPPSLVRLPARPSPVPGTLPIPLTRLVGRAEERATIARLLSSGRLVTLTGAGGVGKTRLALDVAATIAADVVFVDLAPLRDPELVPAAIARALGLRDAADLPLPERLALALRTRSLLLVLDNFEHLLPAALLLPQLLRAAPQLTLLVTSRAPLRLRGERTVPIAPLAQPDPADIAVEALAHSPAVALFVERAQEVRPDFALTPANAAAVSEICRRLDGLPLALELAAARLRHLSAAAIAARLDARLLLLTGGPRDLPQRQQTLRATLAWSYDLLMPAEQQLFRRLAVFAGGCTLDAATAICASTGDPGVATFAGLAALLDASLLQRSDGPDGEPRFRMLETVREYAGEQLAASAEAATVRRRHADFFVALAEALEPRLRQAGREPSLRRLDAELDNLRLVRAWSGAETDAGRAALRLAGALWRYWWERDALGEGRQATMAALTLPAAHHADRTRAAALLGAGFLTREGGDDAAARVLLEQCVRLGPEKATPATYAAALAFLATLLAMMGDLTAARRLAEESRSRAAAAGELFALTWANAALVGACLRAGDRAAARVYADETLRCGRQIALEPIGLHTQAMVDLAEGQYEQARVRFSELLALAQARDSAFLIARTLHMLAVIALQQGDLPLAETLLQESIARTRRIGVDVSPVLATLGQTLLQQGNTQAAVAICAQCLASRRGFGPSPSVLLVLGVLAQAAERRGLLTDCARLLAASAVQRNRFAVEQVGLQAVERVRTALGEAAFAEAWAAGATLSADEAIELGLAAVGELQQLLTTDTAAVDQDR